MAHHARLRVGKRLDRAARIGLSERHVTAREDPAARVENVIAQDDVLAGNVRLVLAAVVVQSDHAAVGRRALRPVDPSALECELLGGMIAGGKAGDEWRDLAALRVDRHDA